MYLETPKTGCSTIKATLQRIELEDPNLPRALDMVHNRDYSPLLKPIQVGKFDKLLEDEKYYKFCFVRNPYTRILSAYLNKVRFHKGQWNEYRRNKLLVQMGGDLSDIQTIQKEISFKNFVRSIIRQPVTFMDPHWKIQYYQTLQELINYDFIGKFENFNKDFLKVLHKIVPDDSKMYILNIQGHKTGANNKIKEFYTEEIRDMVYTKYKVDFEQFGYSSVLSEISSEQAGLINSQDFGLLSNEEMENIFRQTKQQGNETFRKKLIRKARMVVRKITNN
jgi:hypothetical protein